MSTLDSDLVHWSDRVITEAELSVAALSRAPYPLPLPTVAISDMLYTFTDEELRQRNERPPTDFLAFLVVDGE